MAITNNSLFIFWGDQACPLNWYTESNLRDVRDSSATLLYYLLKFPLLVKAQPWCLLWGNVALVSLPNVVEKEPHGLHPSRCCPSSPHCSRVGCASISRTQVTLREGFCCDHRDTLNMHLTHVRHLVNSCWIHSFSKYSFNSYFVPGTCSEVPAGNKTHKKAWIPLRGDKQ